MASPRSGQPGIHNLSPNETSPPLPVNLTSEPLRAFQVHLVAGGISWPALNQIVCALRFFYGVTLGQGTMPERIPYAREPRAYPARPCSSEGRVLRARERDI